jgi:hypothetical protein
MNTTLTIAHVGGAEQILVIPEAQAAEIKERVDKALAEFMLTIKAPPPNVDLIPLAWSIGVFGKRYDVYSEADLEKINSTLETIVQEVAGIGLCITKIMRKVKPWL